MYIRLMGMYKWSFLIYKYTVYREPLFLYKYQAQYTQYVFYFFFEHSLFLFFLLSLFYFLRLFILYLCFIIAQTHTLFTLLFLCAGREKIEHFYVYTVNIFSNSFLLELDTIQHYFHIHIYSRLLLTTLTHWLYNSSNLCP